MEDVFNVYTEFSISLHRIRERDKKKDNRLKKGLQVKGKICIFDLEVSRPFNNN